ncbi:MAG TPA: hypothetical protein VGY58_18290 [Gemmataceae bacterium]|nr:hypothetical protein [Gemmataceae bacterium]
MDAISAVNSAPVRQRAAYHRAALATMRPDLSTWHYALLVLLPLLLLAVNHSWLASSLFLDPYIYLGYYLDLPGHFQALPDNYITTRLPVLLPGWLAHACLPVLAANAVLHLGLYYVCVFCLYRIVTGVAGRRAGLLACILLGANSFFQSAVGTDYTDGYAIAFILTGLDFLQSAARAARPGLRLIGAGAALAALVYSNVFFSLFACLAGLLFMDANRRGRRHSLAAVSVWLVLGFALLTGVFMLVNFGLCGRLWFFLPNAAASIDLARHHTAFRHQGWSWLLEASWLAGPVSAALGGGLCFWMRRGAGPSSGAWTLLWLAFAIGLLLVLERGHVGVIRFWYYATPLLPFVLLFIGQQIGDACAALSGKGFAGVLGVALAAALFIQAAPGQQTAWTIGQWGAFAGPVASGSVAFICLRLCRPGAALLGFVLLWSGSTCWAKAAFRYESPWPEVPAEIYDRIREHDPQRLDVLRAVTDTVRTVQQVEKLTRVRFWYQYDEPLGLVFREIACTNFFNRVNEHFPATTGIDLSSQGNRERPLLVAVLSQQGDVLQQVQAALAPIALSAVPRVERRIHHRRIAFTLIVLEVKPLRE